MPNTVVKLINAESTWPEAAREDRKLLVNKKKASAEMQVLFACLMEWPVGRNRREEQAAGK